MGACRLYSSLGLNMGLIWDADLVIPYKRKTSSAIQITTASFCLGELFRGWDENIFNNGVILFLVGSHLYAGAPFIKNNFFLQLFEQVGRREKLLATVGVYCEFMSGGGGQPVTRIFTIWLLAINWDLLTAEGPPFCNHWSLNFELQMEQTVVIDHQDRELFFTAFKFFPCEEFFFLVNLLINPFLYLYIQLQLE